jgi:hypothetical protein
VTTQRLSQKDFERRAKEWNASRLGCRRITVSTPSNPVQTQVKHSTRAWGVLRATTGLHRSDRSALEGLTPHVTRTFSVAQLTATPEEVERLSQALEAIANGDVHGDRVYEDWFDAVQVIEKFARETLGEVSE